MSDLNTSISNNISSTIPSTIPRIIPRTIPPTMTRTLPPTKPPTVQPIFPEDTPSTISSTISSTSTKIQSTKDICNTTTDIPNSDDIEETINSSHFINKYKRKNYTPFGMEFKKITSTFLYNYGMNFSIEIPVVGNILYRSFFEIELPVLNFTDSIITDIVYTEYKAGQLSDLSNEISKWTDYYSTMNSFSNIMIEVYVEAKKILKLQNITLSFLQSRVLNIINKYSSDLYKYRLLIDPNILTSVDIAAYIVGLTELVIATVDSTIDTMYNTNINYLNYYYGNINYYTKKYNTVSEGKILCKWIDNLGHYYFNFFELVVNGNTVDNYSNDFLHIYQTHSILSHFKENYNRMIGNTDEIYINKGSPNYIYTPLIFSYNNINEPSQSLPLVGMMNSTIKINSRVNELKNLVYLQDWEAMFEELKIVELRRDQHTIDAKNNVAVASLPYSTVELLLPENIYIYKCSYVNSAVLQAKGISDLQANTIISDYGTNGKLSLDQYIYLMNNIKTLDLDENTKKNLAGYHYFIDYNYVLNLIPKPKVSLLCEYGFIDNFEKQIMAQNNLDYVIETHHEIVLDINETSIYDSLNDVDGLVKDVYVFGRKKLNLDAISPYGKSEYTNFDSTYIDDIQLNVSNEFNFYEYYNIRLDSFNNRASYEYLNYPIPYGVYYRTFSLHPNSIQPSGFINMKQIVGQNIAVTVNDNYSTDYYNSDNNPYNLGIEFKILYTKYNILKVKEGNLELAFYN